MTRPCSEILRELRDAIHETFIASGTYTAVGAFSEIAEQLVAEADEALAGEDDGKVYTNAEDLIADLHKSLAEGPHEYRPTADINSDACVCGLPQHHELHTPAGVRDEPVGEVTGLTGSLRDMTIIKWFGEQPAVGTKLYASPQPAPEGWQLVPKEPTEDMLKAMGYADPDPDPDEDLFGWPRSEYKAALAAAPLPPPPASEPSE